ncbi:MAG: radical SAM protein [Prevotella sp.]|jgi:organic radical activating enzyme|nr:radical SAM protein [Prevotella sp.]
MKVNEIFYSLQGEGVYTGTAAVFLRLSGCNMKCWFCDTKGHEQGTEMTEEEIAERVSQYPARHIVITGGEPTMQLNARLTQLLHEKGFFIQIETNGALPLKDGTEVDWITCSPKGNEIKIQRIDELKLLFIKEYLEKYKEVKASQRCLQPLDEGGQEVQTLASQAGSSRFASSRGVQEVISYIKEHPQWRLSLQTHKLINIP